MPDISVKAPCKEQSHHYYACILSLHSTKYQRVLLAMCALEAMIRRGEKERGKDDRQWLAKEARVSLSTVRNVIRDCENDFFTHKNERRRGSHKHLPNVYNMQPYFFEFVSLMAENQLLHKWKGNAEALILELENNPYFLVEKTLRKWRLSTTNLPTAFMLNLPTVKSYSSELLLEEYRRRGAFEQSNVHKEKEAKKQLSFWINPILKTINVDYKAQLYASRHAREKEIVEAVDAFRFQTRRKEVPNKSAYFIGTIQNKIRERRPSA